MSFNWLLLRVSRKLMLKIFLVIACTFKFESSMKMQLLSVKFHHNEKKYLDKNSFLNKKESSTDTHGSAFSRIYGTHKYAHFPLMIHFVIFFLINLKHYLIFLGSNINAKIVQLNSSNTK